MTVALVDYGLGNLGSVENMLRRVGASVTRVQTPEDIVSSDRVLLPGVGSFDAGMQKLNGLGLRDGLREFAKSGKPLLGICLGMQLLFDSSQEGSLSGLQLIPGGTVRLSEAPGARVPHMGWSALDAEREDPLIAGLPNESRFYFVHSYHVVPHHESAVLATSEYGQRFVSMVQESNVMGAQFHPEKSHSFGMTLLKNFVAL